jgi:hypothetical protein
MTHRPFLLLLLICLITRVSCLYFYLEGTEKKCFIEDLPKETMVIGKDLTLTRLFYLSIFNKYRLLYCRCIQVGAIGS